MPMTIPNKDDGTFDLNQLAEYIRPTDDPHQPHTGLITVENTHCNCGGKVLPLKYLAEVTIASFVVTELVQQVSDSECLFLSVSVLEFNVVRYKIR